MHKVGKTIRSDTIMGKTPNDLGAPDMSNATHRTFTEDCADQRRILHSEDISGFALAVEIKADAKPVLIRIAILCASEEATL